MSGQAERLAEVQEMRGALHSMFGTGAPRAAAALPELLPLPVTGPGFYRMTAAQYHADPCPEPSLSASLACVLLDQAPAHARLKHPRLSPDIVVEDKAEHFDIGELAHAILLEGRGDLVKVLDFPDWRKKEAQIARDDARLEGKVPLLRKTWETVDAMVRTTRGHLDVHEEGRLMFRDGLAEPVAVWREGELWMRARLDYLRVGVRGLAVDDYKTTARSAHPAKVAKLMFEHGWDTKLAFYSRGVEALTGVETEFRFAVQETSAPHALSVVTSAPSVRMYAQSRIERAIELWHHGVADNAWPSYPLRTAHVELPSWLEKAWYDQEANDAV